MVEGTLTGGQWRVLSAGTVGATIDMTGGPITTDGAIIILQGGGSNGSTFTPIENSLTSVVAGRAAADQRQPRLCDRPPGQRPAAAPGQYAVRAFGHDQRRRPAGRGRHDRRRAGQQWHARGAGRRPRQPAEGHRERQRYRHVAD
jgi:hypothetical protein